MLWSTSWAHNNHKNMNPFPRVRPSVLYRYFCLTHPRSTLLQKPFWLLSLTRADAFEAVKNNGEEAARAEEGSFDAIATVYARDNFGPPKSVGILPVKKMFTTFMPELTKLATEKGIAACFGAVILTWLVDHPASESARLPHARDDHKKATLSDITCPIDQSVPTPTKHPNLVMTLKEEATRMPRAPTILGKLRPPRNKDADIVR